MTADRSVLSSDLAPSSGAGKTVGGAGAADVDARTWRRDSTPWPSVATSAELVVSNNHIRRQS